MRPVPVCALVLCLAGCAAAVTRNTVVHADAAPWQAATVSADEVWVGLAFSGGGHRATAFGYGVFDALLAAGLADGDTLADRVQFVAGVSGGAVLATKLALDGPDGLAGFRADYLLTDAGRHMPPAVPGAVLDSVPAVGFAADLALGADGPASLGRALDENLLHGARFGDLPGDVMLRLVASDLDRAAPFVFDPATFAAFCADLDALPLSTAVAASAAFPVIFAPVTLTPPRRDCERREPAALAAARQDAAAHPALRLLATTRAAYADPGGIAPIRLLDGGMADSYGTSGFLAARAEGGLSPISPAAAVRVRHMLFVAVDAAQENWRLTDELLPTGRVLALSLYGLPQRVSGDGGSDLDPFLSGRAITATTTGSFATLRMALTAWHDQIVTWRCSLDATALDALYPDRPADWLCTDVTIHLAEVGIDSLPDPLRAAMAEVPTRLHLTADQVDLAIAAGSAGLRSLPVWRNFRRALQAE